MFDSKLPSTPPKSPLSYPTGKIGANNGSGPNILGTVFFFSIVFLAAVGGGLGFYLYNSPKTVPPVQYTPAEEQIVATNTSPNNLGQENTRNDSDNGEEDGVSKDLKADEVFFGKFYQRPSQLSANIKSFNVPIDTKRDVENYYDVSRKIDMSQAVPLLDKQAVAVMNNPWAENNDFFSAYLKLWQKDVPMYISTDFVVYNYQKVLKDLYRDIERTAFYDNLWNFSSELYSIARTRFQKRYGDLGIKNEPLLEAERMEAAYFMIALELLKPKAAQIDKQVNFTDETKFIESEKIKYDYIPLETIKDDVQKELRLIAEAKGEARSPITMNMVDYSSFKLTKEQAKNARMSNFYLATKWLSQSFPLYYKSESCAGCNLDKNDWLVNFMAANIIASDIYNNQNSKNNLAIIYKIKSYFSGLRKELTYLEYFRSYKDVYGDDNFEIAFSQKSDDLWKNISSLQSKIFSQAYNELEGGVARSEKNRALVGLKLLQEKYSPNDLVFSRLTYPSTGKYLGQMSQGIPAGSAKSLSCIEKNIGTIRCKPHYYDILSLIHDYSDRQDYRAFSNFENYASESDQLKKWLDKFDQNAWHNSFFWSNMQMISMLDKQTGKFPVYHESSAWHDRIETEVLAAWVNMNLPGEAWKINENEAVIDSSLADKECNLKNYIEPNAGLYAELLANAKLLQQVMTSINIDRVNDSATIMLAELIDKLEKINDIVKREYANEGINANDCRFIEKFVLKNMLAQPKPNRFTAYPGMVFDLPGVKLIAVVNQIEEKKWLILGPIFDVKQVK